MKQYCINQFFFLIILSVNTVYSQRHIKSIDKASFVELMKTGDFQLLDVRTEKEFNLGAIEGAINIDYWDPDFEHKVMSTLNKGIITIVYCAAGGRSEMACQLLSKKGFKSLYDFQGGYEYYTN